jgi:predicted DsbA family dithiol-disulfide isomerase
MQQLQLDIWSDIACPWCWVGKRHLEAALEVFEHRDSVDVTWHAFELDPTSKRSATEVDYAERLGRKYGTDRAGGQAMIDRMTNTAAAEGLTMNFEHIKPGNTFDAHRLVHLALTVGKQDAMKERLFAAYLEQGEAIDEVATLVKLAVEVGLDEATVMKTLKSEAFAEDVREDERNAQRLGVRGVPFFVVDGKLAFSGAQPSEVIVSVLERGWADRDTPVTASAEACGPAGCS